MQVLHVVIQVPQQVDSWPSLLAMCNIILPNLLDKVEMLGDQSGRTVDEEEEQSCNQTGWGEPWKVGEARVVCEGVTRQQVNLQAA